MMVSLHTPWMGGIVSGGSRWSRKNLCEREPKNVVERLNHPVVCPELPLSFSLVESAPPSEQLPAESLQSYRALLLQMLQVSCQGSLEITLFLASHVYIGGHVDQKHEYLSFLSKVNVLLTSLCLSWCRAFFAKVTKKRKFPFYMKQTPKNNLKTSSQPSKPQTKLYLLKTFWNISVQRRFLNN